MKPFVSDKGYLFSEVRLKEGKPVMIAREANFIHRRGITMADLLLMKENFDNNVLGLDAYFDFNHDETKPAGWIKSVELGETKVDGKTYAALFAVPEWNPDGQEALKGGKYKYVSPEIFWEWLHPETGKKYKSVLRSVAILNRPQIPGQPSIKFSEVLAGADREDVQNEDDNTKEATMFKKLKEFAAKIFGAKFGAEDVTEEQIIAAFEEKFKKDADAAKLTSDELKKTADELADLKVKYTAIEGGSESKFKEALEKIESKFNEKLEEMKKSSFAEKVTALVEKAKEEKLTPAEADGWFKELCQKDLALAEKTFASLPVKIRSTKPETEVDVNASPDDMKGVSAMREEMAKTRGVKFSEVTYREAYDAFYDKKSRESAKKDGE
jgi:hypothetical protein